MKTAAHLIANAALLLAAIYMAVAMTIGRFRHPWMSETELFLNMPELIQLKEIPKP